MSGCSRGSDLRIAHRPRDARGMASRDFESFRSGLMERHTNPVTSALSTVGDAFWLAAVPAALVTRRVRVFRTLFLIGTVIATGAHLFQPGTVKDEVFSVL